jgi:hypothetical protein
MKLDPFSKQNNIPAFVFTLDNRYSEIIFQDIILDTRASGISTARKPQVIALQKLNLSIKINISIAGFYQIKFGAGEIILISIIYITTPISNIPFHVLLTNISFLLCLQDINKLGIQFDNIRNLFVRGNKILPIICK